MEFDQNLTKVDNEFGWKIKEINIFRKKIPRRIHNKKSLNLD